MRMVTTVASAPPRTSAVVPRSGSGHGSRLITPISTTATVTLMVNRSASRRKRDNISTPGAIAVGRVTRKSPSYSEQ